MRNTAGVLPGRYHDRVGGEAAGQVVRQRSSSRTGSVSFADRRTVTGMAMVSPGRAVSSSRVVAHLEQGALDRHGDLPLHGGDKVAHLAAPSGTWTTPTRAMRDVRVVSSHSGMKQG